MRVQNLLSFSWQTLPSGQSYLRRLSDIVRVFWFYRKFQTLCTPSKNIEGPFALFAFQNEPEFAVQGRCRKNNNQVQIARELAMSMPAGITLLLKEHAWIGNRSLSAYEDLVKLPNVKMIPFYEKAADLIPHSVFVASLNGSVLFEAAMSGKPAISFSGTSEFLCLENVTYVQDLTKLHHIVGGVCNEFFSIRARGMEKFW